MDWQVAGMCLLIMVARVTDITVDTIRMVAVIQGRRFLAAALGFTEAVVYIFVVAKVLQNFDHPVYALAYGGGFACGTYLGMTIEKYLAFGEQLACIFTRRGYELAGALRAEGYRLTESRGRGRDGEVSILYVKLSRKQTPQLIGRARELDGDCYYVVNDVRMSRADGAATLPVRRRLVA